MVQTIFSENNTDNFFQHIPTQITNLESNNSNTNFETITQNEIVENTEQNKIIQKPKLIKYIAVYEKFLQKSVYGDIHSAHIKVAHKYMHKNEINRVITLKFNAFESQNIPLNETIVIKKYNIDMAKKHSTSTNTIAAEDMQTELKIHKFISQSLPHKFILKMYDVINTPYNKYAILEYCPKGDLLENLKDNPDNFPIKKYFAQLIVGIKHLHDNNICHRDLSLENILIGNDTNIRICDFGVCCAVEPNTFVEDKIARSGKVNFYMAPEVYSQTKYDPFKADVWTCGVILFTMYLKKYPFKYATSSDLFFDMIYNKGTNGISQFLIKTKNQKLISENIISHHLMSLLSNILCDAKCRYTVDDILDDPFFLSCLVDF
jgi:serine/threonine protein kinase